MINRVLGRLSCSSAQISRKNNEFDKEKSEPTASKEKEFVIPTKSFLSREWVSYHLLLLKERNYESIQSPT